MPAERKASICDALENPWPRSLAAKLKRSKRGLSKMKYVSSQGQKRWKTMGWCSGGSVTLHANDRSAAGSAGSPPHRYALVCGGSKAAPTRWDRPTLTDWQRQHAPSLSCCTLTDWLVRRRATLTVAAVTPVAGCVNMNPRTKTQNHLCNKTGDIHSVPVTEQTKLHFRNSKNQPWWNHLHTLQGPKPPP